MYSVVLLLAATTNTETTACHRLFRGRDCGAATQCCSAPVVAPVACCGTTTPPPPPPPPVVKKETIKPPVKTPEKVPETKTPDKVPDKTPEKPTLPTPPMPPKTGQLDAPARILVHLPADASLTIDGYVTKSTSETRAFVSPMLTARGEHFYELQATIQRSGQQVRITRLIRVQAGTTTEVNLEEPVSQNAVTLR
jgi:uncharacterized protein (TIGR03000 family)